MTTQPAPGTAPDHSPAPVSRSEDEELPGNIYRLVSERTGAVSYYGNFRLRRFADIGGARRVVLREAKSGRPVTTLERAKVVYAEVLEALEGARKSFGLLKLGYDPTLGAMAREHLLAADAAPGHAPATVDRDAAALMHFVRYFDNARLSAITGPMLEAYAAARALMPGVRPGTTVAPSTIRNEINALSGMYQRAIKWKLIFHNPVRDMTIKLWALQAREAAWLSREELALLLDAAARLDAETRDARALVAAHRAERENGHHTCRLPRVILDTARRYPHCEAVLTALAYTGGRLHEVLGLEVRDLEFDRGTVYFRHNAHRRLKRPHHVRRVKMWRPLADRLRSYLAETGITSGLVFPSEMSTMMGGFATPFARCLAASGIDPQGRHITRHTLRHTHATLLLQTMVRAEDGRWVQRSSDSVARVLGHRTSRLIETTYGHELVGAKLHKRLSCERYRVLPAARFRPSAPPAPAGDAPQSARRLSRGPLTLVA